MGNVKSKFKNNKKTNKNKKIDNNCFVNLFNDKIYYLLLPLV